MTTALQSITLKEQCAQCVTQREAECITLPAMTDRDVDLPGCYTLPDVCMQTSKQGKYIVE